MDLGSNLIHKFHYQAKQCEFLVQTEYLHLHILLDRNSFRDNFMTNRTKHYSHWCGVHMKAHICEAHIYVAERIFNFVKLIKCLSILFIIFPQQKWNQEDRGGTAGNCIHISLKSILLCIRKESLWIFVEPLRAKQME